MISLLTDHLLSLIIAVPFLGMIVLAFLSERKWVLSVTLAITLINAALAFYLWNQFSLVESGMQFVERLEWMPTFGIEYAVGVDGISLLLVLLTTILPPLCVLGSWDSITSRLKAFMMLILLVEGAMLVVFTALDAFLFFMMWEVTMVPMYFMIVLWGGPNRIAAGLKYVLYSLSGSLLLLVGILALVSSGWHLRHSITGGFHLFRKLRVLDISGIVFGLCDQASHVAISHLASRRALRGSNRR